MDGLYLNVLNPRKGSGKRRKKNMPKRGKDGKYKKGGRRKPRKRNPSVAAAAPRRRRRRRARRRTRNPSSGGGGGSYTIASGLKNFWPRFLGKLWVVWAVRRFGNFSGLGTGSVIPGAPATASPFAGRSWTMGNYIVGYLALKFVANMLTRNRGREWVNNFFHGGFDALATKLVWTEAFARSPWLQGQFGQTGHQQGAVMQDPNTGQTYMMQGGQWQALQGMGQMVEEGPLDGFGQLVDAGPLDGGMGQLVDAGPMDGMGQMMPLDTPRSEATDAAYGGRGSSDPYTASYMGHRDPYAATYAP